MSRADASLLAMRGHYEAHRLGVDATVQKANRYADDTLGALNNVSLYGRRSVAVLGLIGFLGVLACVSFLARETYRRVGGEPALAVAMTDRIAAGDLKLDQAVTGQGILGALGNMRVRLRGLVKEMGACAESIATIAPQMVLQADKTQEAAKRQAADAAEIAATAEELSASVASAVDNANVASVAGLGHRRDCRAGREVRRRRRSRKCTRSLRASMRLPDRCMSSASSRARSVR
jgi:methyl-accepting chemotaxis protein